MVIWKTFRFEAAHRLEGLPHGHPCGRLHGHGYVVTIHVGGEIVEPGWVIDFAELKVAWNYACGVLDHSSLNDIHGLGNPTSENLAVWMWGRLIEKLPQLTMIEVSETCTSGVQYRGEDER